MEQKAPRLSSASLVAGGLCVAFSVINSTTNLVFDSGFTIEEMVSLALAGCSFIVSFLASRERPIPELLNQPTIQEQYDAMESTPTPYRTSSPQQAPVQPELATNSQSISASLEAMDQFPSPVEATATPDSRPEDVAAALASLSTGSFGMAAAEQVAVNPAPHIHTEQGRPFTQPVGSLAESFERTPVTNVPLPSSMDQPAAAPSSLDQLPSMPNLDDLIRVPVPHAEPAQQEIVVPAIPDLDDLFEQEKSPVQAVPPTPDLPDLDGLF